MRHAANMRLVQFLLLDPEQTGFISLATWKRLCHELRYRRALAVPADARGWPRGLRTEAGTVYARNTNRHLEESKAERIFYEVDDDQSGLANEAEFGKLCDYLNNVPPPHPSQPLLPLLLLLSRAYRAQACAACTIRCARTTITYGMLMQCTTRNTHHTSASHKRVKQLRLRVTAVGMAA